MIRKPHLSVRDRSILLLANIACYLRHPVIVMYSVRRSRTWLRPATPRTILEKFIWRKLFDRNPLFKTACDKIAAKEYALTRCPELKTADIRWLGTDPESIPFELLDGTTVLKANHGSGWNLLQPHKLTRNEIVHRARRWMNTRYGRTKGEWGYANVPRRILVEDAVLEDGELTQTEYKFHVCCGTTAYVFLKLRQTGTNNARFITDRDGNAYALDDSGCRPFKEFEPADSFYDMRRIAERLAEPFDFVRCDFYSMPGGIYFSELTVYPMSGHGNNGHPELVALRNSLWDIRKSWFLSTSHHGLTGLYAASLRLWLDHREQATTG